MRIDIQKIDPAQAKPIPTEGFGFGKIFTNHMLTRHYSGADGWMNPQIEPYGPIPMELSLASLHYAQEIFEGTKAYRRPDGAVNLFRIQENIKRFNRSAERLAMPTMDEEEHLDCIVTLMNLDEAWVPAAPKSSLYIRPTMISSEATIGKMSGSEFLFFILLSPVDPYFATGFKPISVFVEDEFVRAVRGGVGDAKTGGNYAASVFATKKAIKAGYKQVVWLDAIERRYVEEMGGMNICFVYGDQIVTPPLNGTILPGVTRESILHLGRDLGYQVAEEMIDINDLMADIKAGKVTEAFACGTAAVIAPIGQFGYKGEQAVVNDNQVGQVTKHLYDELTGIQYGRIADRFGWTLKIDGVN
ncbi:MAG: branched-chain amino acid aminotransferase [Ardenticatenaceae bacterium]|nr:branched-chain amino acid aminotransferase [Ardenticatenaceae bacterium]